MCLRLAQCQPDDPVTPPSVLGTNRQALREELVKNIFHTTASLTVFVTKRRWERREERKEEKMSKAVLSVIGVMVRVAKKHPKSSTFILTKAVCGGTEGPIRSNRISRGFGIGGSDICKSNICYFLRGNFVT